MIRQVTMVGLVPGLLCVVAAVIADDADEAATVKTIKTLATSFVLTRDLGRDDTPVIGVRLAGNKGVDAMLKEIKKLKSLKSLNICKTDVSDAGLKELRALGNLRELSLGSCSGITGAGLEHLGDIKGLRVLDLSDTRADDTGLEHLKELKNLQVLDVSRTLITSAGLGTLREFKSLKQLGLNANQRITDAGLWKLRELKTLRLLAIGDSNVTKEGVDKLQTALPDTFILPDENGWNWLKEAKNMMRHPPEALVTATALLRQHEGNEIAADREYKGKVILVSGIVKTVGRDTRNTAYVTLGGDKTKASLASVQCFFAASQEEELAELRRGDSVIVLGTCSGKLGNVLLKDCGIFNKPK